MIYLFANDSVLDFYPNFGFIKFNEYQYFIKTTKNSNSLDIRKIDMNNSQSRNFVYKMVEKSLCISKISMISNPNLIMFYGIYFMKN